MRRFAGPYVGLFTVFGTLAGLWLAERKPDDLADYSWLLPVVCMAPIAVIASWELVRRLPGAARDLLRDWIGVAVRDKVIADLKVENAALRDRLGLVPTELDRAYDAGIAEGFRRIRGHQAGQKIRSLPTNVVAVGGQELRLIVSAGRASTIVAGARLTLADVVNDAPVGVLEVLHVTPGGEVVLTCVDRVQSDYWTSLDLIPATESRVLFGTHLISYDPFLHHSLSSPTPISATIDANPQHQESA